MSLTKNIESHGLGDNSPLPAGRTYRLDFHTPEVVTPAMMWQFAFDLVNFYEADSPSAALRLESLRIERRFDP